MQNETQPMSLATIYHLGRLKYMKVLDEETKILSNLTRRLDLVLSNKYGSWIRY